MLEFLLSLIFPPKCPICGESVEENGKICDKCFAYALNVRKSNKHSSNVREIFVLTNYENAVKKIIADLKFEKRKSRLKNTDYILEKADKLIREYPPNILAVYVPISRERMKERGFNQVELIFKNWLRKRKISCKEILTRQKATEHQFLLTPEKRAQNVANAFIATVKLNGEDILLLDDIITTGATLEECAKTLKEAGAGRIFALVLSGNR